MKLSVMADTTSVRGPLAKARIDGVFVYVRDFPRMLDFYRDTLGFAVAYQNDHFASLRSSEGAEIELHGGRESTGSEGNHWFLHITVEDIQATAEELSRRGVTVSEIREEPYGKIAGFKDPEGNEIGLEQPPEH
jgi:predicted enzyme related to lactoylglutathione lyase